MTTRLSASPVSRCWPVNPDHIAALRAATPHSPEWTRDHKRHFTVWLGPTHLAVFRALAYWYGLTYAGLFRLLITQELEALVESGNLEEPTRVPARLAERAVVGVDIVSDELADEAAETLRGEW